MTLSFLKKKLNFLKTFFLTPPPNKYALAIFYILNKCADIKKVTFIKRTDKDGKLVTDSVRVNLITGFDIEVSYQLKKDLKINETNAKPGNQFQSGAWQIIANQLTAELDKEIKWECVIVNGKVCRIIGFVPDTDRYFVLTYV